MHSSYYRQMVFTQKVLRTEVLRTEGFTHNTFLHTDAFIHRCLYTEDKLHTETCAHSTLLHATNFYTERFCFSFLITYLSCSPSQVVILLSVNVIYIITYLYPINQYIPIDHDIRSLMSPSHQWHFEGIPEQPHIAALLGAGD